MSLKVNESLFILFTSCRPKASSLLLFHKKANVGVSSKVLKRNHVVLIYAILLITSVNFIYFNGILISILIKLWCFKVYIYKCTLFPPKLKLIILVYKLVQMIFYNIYFNVFITYLNGLNTCSFHTSFT